MAGLSFEALKRLSFTHSLIYFGLLLAAFGVAPFEDAKTALGWAHGVGWIFMSLLCIAAVRARVIPLRLAVAVVVIGGVGPFIGSIEFIRTERSLKTTRLV